MQIIITLKDTTHKAITTLNTISEHLQAEVVRAIKDGTELPKGHGRLVDENEVDGLRYKYFDFSDNEVNCIKRGIDRLTTIIEADKEVENEADN